jgi:hypothetical protein
VSTSTSPFETLLRRLRRRESVPALVQRLGIEPALHCIARDAWPSLGLTAEEDVEAIFIAGERGSLRVLLLELVTDPAPAAIGRIARSVAEHALARQHLFLAVGPSYRRILIGCLGTEGELRHLPIDLSAVRRTDIDALEEMVAEGAEGGVSLTLRHARALDRSRVTRQFFEDFAGRRARVASAWTGIPAGAAGDREQLALLLLCRLMFLYFLQRRGQLAGDTSYIGNRWTRWRRQRRVPGSFFRCVIDPLFFGALNRRPADRDAAAAALGNVPYLNGGLFEKHAIERRHSRLDLADDVVGDVIDGLFERYRFTTRDSAEDVLHGVADAGVDPEMLGRVFEGMMAAGQRGDTGTYYTPATVVDGLVSDALRTWIGRRTRLSADVVEAVVTRRDVSALDGAQRATLAAVLRDVRALDPACGSGAFLLGALSRVASIRRALGENGDVRREIVGSSLHGVDVQGDAALLCALRLWLALAVEAEAADEPAPPLPNLDRRIRQGDALLDPLDLADGGGAGPDGGASIDADVRRALRRLTPAGRRYLSAEPGEKDALKRELSRSERELARAWLTALDRRLAYRVGELRSVGASRDLWGDDAADAAAARAAIPPLESRRRELAGLAAALEDTGTLPFFSFRVHFAEAQNGFDMVLSNPPWVRSHRWPASVGALVRRRYSVCREPGWPYGAKLAGAPGAAGAQVDLSQLFLERSLALLAHGGVLAMLLPAKTFRSLYGGAARRMLLRETRIAAIDDYSLDQRAVFRADAFAGAVTACKAPAAPGEAAPVRVRLIRRNAPPLRFEQPQAELSLFEGDAEAPWLLAPARVRRALRAMQAAGPALGASGVRVRRGVFTGANSVLLIREAEPKIGGLCRIRAQGFFDDRRSHAASDAASSFEALVESAAIRPCVRGADVSAWRYNTGAWVIWLHDESGRSVAPPPRLARYLARHSTALRARSGVRPGSQPGSLFRVTPAALGPKVAWHDLALTLEAVAIPATVPALGCAQPAVPLNTVYFIATPTDEEALLLAAFLNSLPVRTFARAIAERAKDARFRFFAWTVAAVPMPRDWRERGRTKLLELSRTAHADGTLDSSAADRLDALVVRAYGLGAAEIDALREWDAWLRGVA